MGIVTSYQWDFDGFKWNYNLYQWDLDGFSTHIDLNGYANPWYCLGKEQIVNGISWVD